MYFNNAYLDVYMDTTITVDNCNANTYGGLFYILNARIVRIDHNTYTTFYAS